MEEVDDAELVVERIAALDLGKAGLEACVRVPHTHRPGRRMQELRGYGTTTAQLLEMVAWLRHWGVQRVVMESTSTYWKVTCLLQRSRSKPRRSYGSQCDLVMRSPGDDSLNSSGLLPQAGMWPLLRGWHISKLE
jgi:hypothetical protein